MTHMTHDQLHAYILELLDLLGDHNVDISDYENDWNMFTDINTNDIRPECWDDVVGLARDMEKKYQSLSE